MNQLRLNDLNNCPNTPQLGNGRTKLIIFQMTLSQWETAPNDLMKDKMGKLPSIEGSSEVREVPKHHQKVTPYRSYINCHFCVTIF